MVVPGQVANPIGIHPPFTSFAPAEGPPETLLATPRTCTGGEPRLRAGSCPLLLAPRSAVGSHDEQHDGIGRTLTAPDPSLWAMLKPGLSM